MRRRDFAFALLLAAAAPPARAQAPGKHYRISLAAVLPADQLSETGQAFWVQFFAALRRLGYVEGRNLTVERHSAEGDPSRYADLVSEATVRTPDLIVVQSGGLALAFKAKTTTIPLVVIDGDPIKLGLVTSLAHPGGNLTGVSVDAGVEIYGKRLQILKELIPGAATVAFIALRGDWVGIGGRELREAAQSLGVALIEATLPQASPEHIRRVFAEIAQQRLDGAVVAPVGLNAHRGLIIELAEKNRLPVMYPARDYVDAGGLMAYATTTAEPADNVADQVRQVLRGAKPGDIPYYQATKLGLAINLKAAAALGLTFPPSIRAQADEVIE